MTSETIETQTEPVINIDELTTGSIDGNGTFDVIMKSLKEHLWNEYEDGRITGTDYANAYVQATMAALQQASLYAISRSKLDAEIALLESQKIQIDKESALADEQKELIKAQTQDVNKGVEIKGYNLDNILPAELSNLTKQGDHLTAQTSLVSKQAEDVAKGTLIKGYQLENIMPAELANLGKQGEHIEAQTELLGGQLQDVQAGSAIKAFQLENVLPAEVANLTKQGSHVEAQTAMLAEQQKEVIAGTALKEYQLSEMLPAEKANLLKKGEGLAAQAEQTRQETTNLKTQDQNLKTKMPIETQILEANLGKITTETVNLTKESAIMEAQAAKEVATTNNIEAQTRQTDYITTTKLPEELLAEQARRSLVDAQVAQTTETTKNIEAERANIGLQGDLLAADAGIKDIELQTLTYTLNTDMPVKTSLLTSELALKDTQADLAQKELLLKESEILLATEDIAVKKAQVELSKSELALKAAQQSLTEKEIEVKEKTIELNEYTTRLKTPAEVELLNEQKDLYKQKGVTEKAQTDATVIGEGSVTDINNKLVKEQTLSFERNANQTAAKIMIDTWTTRHNNDPDGNPETSPGLRLTNADIGNAVAKIL